MAANLLIHIPHASLCLPPDFWRDVTVDRKIIEKDLRFMADYKVDELVRDVDCHKVIAKYSRLYCDVERFRNDTDGLTTREITGAVSSRPRWSPCSSSSPSARPAWCTAKSSPL